MFLCDLSFIKYYNYQLCSGRPLVCVFLLCLVFFVLIYSNSWFVVSYFGILRYIHVVIVVAVVVVVVVSCQLLLIHETT